MPSPEAALDLFNLLQDNDPASLAAFEYMSNAGMDLLLQTIPGTVFPLPKPAPHYILTEFATPGRDAELRADMTKLFETAFKEGIVSDAAIAASARHRAVENLHDARMARWTRVGCTAGD